jgi:hypothetical protein
MGVEDYPVGLSFHFHSDCFPAGKRRLFQVRPEFYAVFRRMDVLLKPENIAARTHRTHESTLYEPVIK